VAVASPAITRVGFVGLGDQGAPMASAIAQAGLSLRVWARRAHTLAAVADVPHAVCESVAELAAASDLLCLCLRTDADVREVLGAALPYLRNGAVVANHGTGSPDVCADFEARGKEFGVSVLDAPVSGGSVGAAAKTLTTMVAGEPEAAQRARPVFGTFSRLVVYLGPAGSAQLAKLLNNLLFAANLKNIEDALDIAEHLGIAPDGLMRIIMASSGSSFAAEALYGHIPADRAQGYRELLAKDLAHFAAAARSRGLPERQIEQTARAGVSGIAAGIAHLSAPGALRTA
jgi:3-hydroxyisobutyrate dehydrogenase-like beta-hydroxyacid dehydrogenase